jgi:dTMP kinase
MNDQEFQEILRLGRELSELLGYHPTTHELGLILGRREALQQSLERRFGPLSEQALQRLTVLCAAPDWERATQAVVWPGSLEELEEGLLREPLLRSVFFSLDGIDGTGKSTQGRLLTEWLRAQGHRVKECTDPGGTAIGEVLRDLVLGHRHSMTPACESLLFMASRAQLTAEVIRPALDADTIVISDRYLLANVVYQGHAGGLDPELLWEAGRLSTGGLEPDLTLVLDLPVELALARRKRTADRVESRGSDYHERVRQGFLFEARRRPDRIRVIDARPPVEVVQETIRQEVARVMEARSGA